MNLININESIPNEFFIFVDQMNFVAQHNLKFTRRFSSGTVFHWYEEHFVKKYLAGRVDYLPFTINNKKDLKAISAFENSITSEYRVEYNAEMHRSIHFPLYPSRLSAVYAFGDFDTCKKTSNKYGWDLTTVKKFKLLKHPLNRVAKVNMEIVSLDRLAQRISFCNGETVNHLWNSYWTGIGKIQMELSVVDGRKIFESSILWEYLIEGQVEFVGDI